MNSAKIYNDLKNSANGAKAHFEVWWALASRAKPEFVSVLDQHSDFFRAAFDAHYTSYFVYLAHLFDERKDSSSIPRYFDAISSTSKATTLQLLKMRFAELEKRAKPLITVRHKTVAHIDVKLTEKDVFMPLNITWNVVRNIIYDVSQFVKEIDPAPVSEGVGYIGVPRDERLIEATMKILQVLSNKQV